MYAHTPSGIVSRAPVARQSVAWARRLGMGFAWSVLTGASAMAAGGAVELMSLEAGAAVPAVWQTIQLKTMIPVTRYDVVAWDGELAIRSQAQASMSLLVRAVSVDLQLTPILCWRWRSEQVLKTADITKKSSDDLSARIYVSMDMPSSSMSLATRAALAIARNLFGRDVPDAALSYVWDNRLPTGTSLPSAYTDRARLVVLKNHESKVRTWHEERRDVLADIQAEFGVAPLRITAVALATDTDNTGEAAQAGFARLRFVARDQSCQAA
jgi:hypothetical protein